MRKLISCLMVLVLMASGVSSAQITKEQMKERKELAKASKKELNERASKAARREARDLTKQGWKVAPGALPMEKQLDRSYQMQYQYDTDGAPLYIMAEGMSIGGNYDAAKMQALELAKQNLAGQIETEVAALVENAVMNQQLEQGDAVSVVRSVLEGKNLISQSLGRIVPIVEAYQIVNGNNRQVLVRIAYSMDMAKNVAKKTIKEDLERRGDALQDKLDELLGW